MLKDFSIQNYRTFKDFHIDDLARVNLIVGKNNSGKTSLLEAIYLLVNQVNAQSLIEVLHNRGEIAEQSSSFISGENQQRSQGYQARHIFYDHQINLDKTIILKSQKEHDLSLKIQVKTPDGIQTPPGLQLYATSEGISSEPAGLLLFFSNGHDVKMPMPISQDGLITAHSVQLWKQYKPNIFVASSNPNLFLTTNNPSLFLATGSLTFEELARLWDGITLTPKEESVIEALKILDPDVQRINFTSRQTFNSGILIKIRNQSNPIPLGSMGEGMRRILTLVMAAVTVENGVLLVDEIDIGLHYEVQTDMWRLLFQVAQQLNLQIFATTHSWDCISAFQEALNQAEDSSIGKLFRLSRKDENIRAVEYTPDELSVAVEEGIEVR